MGKLRIYVGGLGASVMEDDLRRTFTTPVLGSVESVEIFRSKDRNFAYLDFNPNSEKGLAKLFSTYNGCMWKGGRLRLEKAKEHYLSRLRREWMEDSELAIKLAGQNSDVEENVLTLERIKKDHDSSQSHLRIFFPKLRKIKPVPFKGTGKHKYSFQRVQIPPLPIHFCDCEEHSVLPSVLTNKRLNKDRETETCGVNEEELDMVKSVLHRLLEKDNNLKAVSDDSEFVDDVFPAHSVDNLEVDCSEEAQLSDEDGLVINTVSHRDNEFAVFLDSKQKRTSSIQNSLVSKSQSLSGNHIPEKLVSHEKKTVHNKRKAAFPSAENASATLFSEKKEKRKHPCNSVGYFEVDVKSQTAEAGTGFIKLTTNAVYSQKNAWKNLVNQQENASFHISDVLAHLTPEVDVKLSQPREQDMQKTLSSKDEESDLVNQKENASFHISDGLTHQTLEVDVNLDPHKELNMQKIQSSKDEESEKLHHIQPIIPSVVEDKKSARGAYWLQNSSWLQLVGSANNNSFNLAQILPGTASVEQRLQQLDENYVSGSRSRRKPKMASQDENLPVQEKKNPQVEAYTHISADSGNPKISVAELLNEEPSHSNLEENVSISDAKETAELDKASASLPSVNLVATEKLPPVTDIVISDTCPFMRTAASMKEWTKMKATVLSTHKKREKVKE